MGHPDVAYPRCGGVTRDGHPCRALALPGGDLCRLHDPATIEDQAHRLIRQQIQASPALRQRYGQKLKGLRAHVATSDQTWELAKEQHGAGSDQAVAAHEAYVRATVVLERLREQLGI